jgi:hypothetical protein
MDNTNNKQFFWQVKDFMTKRHEPKVNKQPTSLQKSVMNVMNGSANVKGPNIYEARNGIVNSSRQAKDSVRHVMNIIQTVNEKQQPISKLYSKNIVSNPFNLFKR